MVISPWTLALMGGGALAGGISGAEKARKADEMAAKANKLNAAKAQYGHWLGISPGDLAMGAEGGEALRGMISGGLGGAMVGSDLGKEEPSVAENAVSDNATVATDSGAPPVISPSAKQNVAVSKTMNVKDLQEAKGAGELLGVDAGLPQEFQPAGFDGDMEGPMTFNQWEAMQRLGGDYKGANWMKLKGLQP